MHDGDEIGTDCGGSCNTVCAVKSASLQPGPGEGISATVSTENLTQHFSGKPLMITCYSGYVNYSFLNFDYSSIPASAQIINATLNLFADTTTNYTNGSFPPGHIAPDGAYNFYLERIKIPWNASTITWVNQPSSDYYSRIALNAGTSRDQAYSINVTDIVKTEFDNRNHYGFVFFNLRDKQLGTIFYSCEGKYPQLRPKLTLQYIE